ncbi:hypothetical protein GCM10010517_29110 [Streptosporangium fragile]|uniref:Carbohydrate kinase FGGY C-terminal domain-containing protein n=1 Tax=Streptosporangium fragile TaxID=46186 RepID=A0ABN3VWY7_9ACTN
MTKEIVAALDRARPVTCVRITGGAFRAPLRRRAVGAMIDRPAVFVSGSEGTALGAAALGPHALGRAPDLAAAPSLLGPA